MVFFYMYLGVCLYMDTELNKKAAVVIARVEQLSFSVQAKTFIPPTPSLFKHE